jgi:hypothetical protein
LLSQCHEKNLPGFYVLLQIFEYHLGIFHKSVISRCLDGGFWFFDLWLLTFLIAVQNKAV